VVGPLAPYARQFTSLLAEGGSSSRSTTKSPPTGTHLRQLQHPCVS
jgi:hypothetical protein